MQYDYEKIVDKIDKICLENKLVWEIQKEKYPVMITLEYKKRPDNQEVMEGLKREIPAGKVQFIFEYPLVVKMDDDFKIEESVFSQLSSSFKKLVALYMEIYFSMRNVAR